MTAKKTTTPATQASDSAEIKPIVPTVNYSRWMSDSFNDIKHMRLWELALPGAHNAGADKGAIDFIGEQWTACQDGRFIEQLRAGARVLDLRLVDNSYKKTTGRHSPQTKFYDVFEFQHGNFGNRRLEHLVADVKAFAEANPREIVMLDFHSYDKGRNFSYNSLERCLKYFQSIKSRLLPRSALNKSLEEIFEDHPSANIALCFKYGNTIDWPLDDPETALLWHGISHLWSPADYSEHGIEQMIIAAMKAPPTNYPWALSATVYEEGINGGPKHLARNHPIRLLPFAEGGRKLNILMADFIEREDTRVSVVDQCIALNLQIGRDRTPPSAPTQFVVRQLRLTDEGAKDEYYQNTALFSFNASTDAVGVRHYLIFQNDKRVFTSGGTNYLVKDLNRLNSVFKVQAVDLAGNLSAFSNEVELLQDTVPPTMPSNLEFVEYGYPTVRVKWVASSDGNGSGVAGYEVRINEVYKGYTSALSFAFHDVPANEQQLIEIRAKDRNGNYSEWAGLIRPALPALVNPQVVYIPLDMADDLFRAVITWDPIPLPNPMGMQIALEFVTDSIPLPLIPFDYGVPSYTDYAQVGDRFIVKAAVLIMGTGEKSPQVTVDLAVDLTIPLPVTNFKVSTQTATDMTLSWDRSASADVVNYAISVHEKPPVVIPASANSFETSKLELAEYPVEIWAIDTHGNASIAESVTASGGPVMPEKPGAPRGLNVSAGPHSAQLNWLPPGDYPVTYICYLEGQQEQHITDRTITVRDLSTNTRYTFVVYAVNYANVRSDPATVTFETLGGLTIPSNFHVTKNSQRNVSFAWEPPRENAEAVIGYSFKIFPSGQPTALAGMTHTVNNLLVGLPMVFGVQCRFAGGGESDWNRITVIPKP